MGVYSRHPRFPSSPSCSRRVSAGKGNRAESLTLASRPGWLSGDRAPLGLCEHLLSNVNDNDTKGDFFFSSCSSPTFLQATL